MRDDRIGGHQTHTTQNCLRKFFKLKGDDGRWKQGSSQSYRDCAKCWFSIRRFKAKILGKDKWHFPKVIENCKPADPKS